MNRGLTLAVLRFRGSCGHMHELTVRLYGLRLVVLFDGVPRVHVG